LCALAVWNERCRGGRPPTRRRLASTRSSRRTVRSRPDQVEHLGYAPRIVFFGGSRAMRFEPKYAQAKTGLKGYNASFIGSKPEDVWAFVHFLRSRAPGTTLHGFLGHPRQHVLRQQAPRPGAASGQAAGALHPLVAAQDAVQYLPDSYAELPYNSMLNRKYLRDGMVVWDNYDRRAQQGYTLAQSLKKYIANLLKHHHGTSPGHPTRARKVLRVDALLSHQAALPRAARAPAHPTPRC